MWRIEVVREVYGRRRYVRRCRRCSRSRWRRFRSHHRLRLSIIITRRRRRITTRFCVRPRLIAATSRLVPARRRLCLRGFFAAKAIILIAMFTTRISRRLVLLEKLSLWQVRRRRLRRHNRFSTNFPHQPLLITLVMI